jgi:hypothetical protein
MTCALRFRFMAHIAVIPFVSMTAGCDSSNARYKPTSGEARSSLEAALTAWREGKPYGSVAGTPPIQVGDSAWQAGQQVESFEIGDEEDSGDATKQFMVKFKMKKPAGEQSVRYFVHGRDPVWVYREEDYKRMANMENNPEPVSSTKSGTRRSSRSR